MTFAGSRSTAALWLPAIMLGLATIGAYGTAYYSIGVLLPVMEAEEGWSTSILSGGFSLGLVGQGAVALLAGRAFDRKGSRAVLLPAICAGSVLLLLASQAAESWQFLVAWAMGGAVIGGGLYYNLTMPAVARLYPGRRTAAFSVLTLLGALASPIFYPIAGWMTEAWGWRGALQGLVALMAVCVAPAALLVRTGGASTVAKETAGAGLRSALGEAAVHRTLLVVALAGMANSALLLHQVPAMQAAGLSLAAASGFAGARGAFQIPGRLLLTPISSRLGIRGTIATCYGFAATAALALLLAVQGGDSLVLAAYFCAIGGMSLGLLSPLNGLFQAEVFGDGRLGLLSGVAVTVSSLASATGALLSGVLIDLTGSYTVPLVLIVLLQALAVLALNWQSRAAPTKAALIDAASSAG